MWGSIFHVTARYVCRCCSLFVSMFMCLQAFHCCVDLCLSAPFQSSFLFIFFCPIIPVCLSLASYDLCLCLFHQHSWHGGNNTIYLRVHAINTTITRFLVHTTAIDFCGRSYYPPSPIVPLILLQHCEFFFRCFLIAPFHFFPSFLSFLPSIQVTMVVVMHVLSSSR